MYINTFRYKPEDVDCKLCTEYRKKLGCTVKGCPFLAERIEAGVVGYGDAVQNTLSHHTALAPRLTALIRLFPGTMWADAGHKPRMEAFKARQGYQRHRDTPAYYAAMYLLTANEDLYRRTANCFCKRGLEFAYALLRGIAPHDYTLFVAARDLFTGADGLTFTDLADPGVVDAEAFRLVVNALLVVRYGPVIEDVFIKKGMRKQQKTSVYAVWRRSSSRIKSLEILKVLLIAKITYKNLKEDVCIMRHLPFSILKRKETKS